MSCQDLEKNFQYCPACCYLFCEGCNHCEQESPSMECEYCGPVGEPCKDCYICISPFACLFVDILWCPGRLGCYVSKNIVVLYSVISISITGVRNVVVIIRDNYY